VLIAVPDTGQAFDPVSAAGPNETASATLSPRLPRLRTRPRRILAGYRRTTRPPLAVPTATQATKTTGRSTGRSEAGSDDGTQNGLSTATGNRRPGREHELRQEPVGTGGRGVSRYQPAAHHTVYCPPSHGFLKKVVSRVESKALGSETPMEILNWLLSFAEKVLPSKYARPAIGALLVVGGVLAVAWLGGASFQDRAAKLQDRAAKLDVLHRLAGYRFLARPDYACRIKDQLIFTLNQVPTVYADHDAVTEIARRLSERPNLLASLQDLIDAMANAAGVTPPPRDSTPFGMTSPLCMEIHSHPPAIAPESGQ